MGDDTIFVVLSIHDLGGLPTFYCRDWSGKQMNLEKAIEAAESYLGFRNAFAFGFARNVLELRGARREKALSQIAVQCMSEEVARIERLKGIVKLNPIFQGRDFLLDENLIFMVGPNH